MGIVEQLDRSKFLKYKTLRKWANPDPPYDPSKDRAALNEKLSIEADCRDDDWWAQFHKDRGRREGIFVPEAADEVKEGQK